ncbi:lariat debranching enzyme [Diachasmimorpha longicaudata]|uniref:lariat debranching enzyme n=1 Tax=Diachasmimorpha longicaudata TaxID=58733 RepID=UPI0030B897FB
MRIAVEGCAHGELEIIYNALEEVERYDGKKIDLLICCGDFQSTRNLGDLDSMAVPDKFKDMGTFYKYYSGEKIAPVLTLFIGGNHEASSYLQELSYGGWVAPKIYYLGYASVVTIGGLRIAGISGIYKAQHYFKGHFELPPYNDSTLRSVYHIRNLEIFRLKQLTGNIDIVLSHDWPNGVTKFGDEQALLRRKKHFKDDIKADQLGSPPCMELLTHHYPKYWFSAHLHCKFAAIVRTEDNTKSTKFLALDKCLTKRPFLQVLDIPHDEYVPMELSYDLEWLTILHLTNHLLSVKNGVHYMPGPGCAGRWNFTPSESEKENVLRRFGGCLRVPENFERTTEAYNPESNQKNNKQLKFRLNKQTSEFCDKLGVDDPPSLLLIMSGGEGRTESPKQDVSGDFDNNSTFQDSIDYDSVIRDEDEGLVESEKEKADEERVETAGESAVEPGVKKFKRRNQAIYEDTSEGME